MTNYGAKILNNSVSSLIAQQAVIATTSNNISNVNTPSYVKRVVNLQTRSSGGDGAGLNVGNGVVANNVERLSDKYLEGQLQAAISDKSNYEIQTQFLDRMAAVFNISGEQPTIGSAFTAFHSALNQLTSNPSSIELRSNLIERGNDLANQIKLTYNTLASLQTEADSRVGTELQIVNQLTGQIANLNGQISSREATGYVAADERDQRDRLLNQLSEKISFHAIETGDGNVNISLDNGFSLVSSTTARSLQATQSPSFAGVSLPPSLGGSVLSYVVFDYNSGGTPSNIDLTQALQGGSGTIGALLKLRGYADVNNTSPFQANGTITEVATRVEAFTRQLLTTVNQTYLGSDEDSGTAGLQPSSGDLNGNSPATYGLFDFSYAGTKDVDGNGIPDDLSAIGLSNFSSAIRFGSSDPRTIAAGLDTNGTAGVKTFSLGDNRNIQNLYARLSLGQTFPFALGSYSFTGLFTEQYDQMVSKVGTEQATADQNLSAAQGRYATAAAHRDEVSAVSIDEEFTNLIRYQKAFEASGRMIKVAQEMLNEIIQLI